MVFESIVVDILNRVLGDYVENLDTKQLKIGIWGGMYSILYWWSVLIFNKCVTGDVVLQNLVLKQNALADLNLPVQTVYGCLGNIF